MASLLKKITNPATGFEHRAYKVLSKKCNVFIAEGEFATTDIPSSTTQLTALYSGANAKFVPLGDMDASGSNITWSARTQKVDFAELQIGVDVVGTLVGITLTKGMLGFVSNLGMKQYSLLFVPDGLTNIFYALSGVFLSTEGNLPIVEESVSKITFKATKSANKVEDVVKYDEFTAA